MLDFLFKFVTDNTIIIISSKYSLVNEHVYKLTLKK